MQLADLSSSADNESAVVLMTSIYKLKHKWNEEHYVILINKVCFGSVVHDVKLILKSKTDIQSSTSSTSTVTSFVRQGVTDRGSTHA